MTDNREKRNISDVLDAYAERIEGLNNMIVGDVIGAAQALDQLRKALDKVDQALDQREFEKASSLGYGEVATEFVFLQRTLGSVQQIELEAQRLVQDVAAQTDGVYENAEAEVRARIEALRVK